MLIYIIKKRLKSKMEEKYKNYAWCPLCGDALVICDEGRVTIDKYYCEGCDNYFKIIKNEEYSCEDKIKRIFDDLNKLPRILHTKKYKGKKIIIFAIETNDIEELKQKYGVKE